MAWGARGAHLSAVGPLGPLRSSIVQAMKLHSYTAYSVGCGIGWARIWGFVETRGDDQTRARFRVGFTGWVAGWTSATIARALYPPPSPKSH